MGGVFVSAYVCVICENKHSSFFIFYIKNIMALSKIQITLFQEILIRGLLKWVEKSVDRLPH